MIRHSAEIVTRPYPIKHALKFNADVHRRLPFVQGAMWAIAAIYPGGLVVGVAIVGYPQARLSCDGWTFEVLRVATDGTPNACSALYGACSRTAKAMGALDLFTFIHNDESGHSLKASGWIDVGQSTGGEWDRKNRQRKLVLDAEPKRKFAPPWTRLALRRQ